MDGIQEYEINRNSLDDRHFKRDKYMKLSKEGFITSEHEWLLPDNDG